MLHFLIIQLSLSVIHWMIAGYRVWGLYQGAGPAIALILYKAIAMQTQCLAHVFRLPAGMSHGLSRAGVPTDRHAGTEDLAFEAVKRISEKTGCEVGAFQGHFRVETLSQVPFSCGLDDCHACSHARCPGVAPATGRSRRNDLDVNSVLHSLRIPHLSPECLSPWMEMTSDLSSQSLVLPLPQNHQALYQGV